MAWSHDHPGRRQQSACSSGFATIIWQSKNTWAARERWPACPTDCNLLAQLPWRVFMVTSELCDDTSTKRDSWHLQNRKELGAEPWKPGKTSQGKKWAVLFHGELTYWPNYPQMSKPVKKTSYVMFEALLWWKQRFITITLPLALVTIVGLTRYQPINVPCQVAKLPSITLVLVLLAPFFLYACLIHHFLLEVP